MTPEERFVFDLEGYLVVKNALSPVQVHELNTIADEVSKNRFNESGEFRVDEVSTWGAPCLALVDNEIMLPYMLELLGPHVRVDHDYCLFMNRSDGQPHGLHGGPYGGPHDEADHWYRYTEGVMRNGLTVFTYCLAPARCRRWRVHLHPGLTQEQPDSEYSGGGQTPRTGRPLRSPASCRGRRLSHLHRGARSRHPPLDSRARAPRPALQVQSQSLRVVETLLRSRQLPRNLGAPAPDHGFTLRGSTPRHCLDRGGDGAAELGGRHPAFQIRRRRIRIDHHFAHRFFDTLSRPGCAFVSVALTEPAQHHRR